MRTATTWIAPLVACAACEAGSLGLGRDAGTMDVAPEIQDDPTPESPPERLFRSGSRLEARFLRAEGGASRFVGWWDRELAIPCRFQHDGERSTRCFPEAETTGSDDLVLVYLDPGCTEPALAIRTGYEVPPAVHYGSASICWEGRPESTAAEAAQVKDELDAEALYELNAGCRPWDRSQHRIFALSPIAPDALVSGTLSVLPLSERLSGEEIAGEDGSRERAGLFDRRRRAPCSFDFVETAESACVPIVYGIHDEYIWKDPDCTIPVALGPGDSCPPAILFVSRSEQPASWHEVGPAVTKQIFVGYGGDCFPRTEPLEFYYEIGPPLKLDAFPTAREVQLGEGRLRAIYRAAENGALLDFVRFEDTATDQPCNPRMLSKGDVRCLPRDLRDESLRSGTFADSSCTVRLHAMDGPEDARAHLLLTHAFSDCQECTTVHDLQPTEAPAESFTNASGECRQRTSDWRHWRRVGPAVDPELFPALTEVRGN